MKSTKELKSLYDNQLKHALQSIEGERMVLRKKYIIGLSGIIIPLLVFFLFKYELTVWYIILIFAIVAPFMYFTIQLEKVKQPYRKKFKLTVVKHIINLINPEWNYNSEGMIPRKDFEACNLFSKNADKYKGDDLVTGIIEKTNFQFSELEVKTWVKSGDKKELQTVFKGLFAHADFNKEIKGETYVFPEAKMGLHKSKTKNVKVNFQEMEPVKLENIEFEKYFSVFGSSQIEARYVLTPTMMEAMVNIKKKYSNSVHFAFVGTKVYIAMNFVSDLFEPRIFSTGVRFEDMEVMNNQFRIIQTLVHELNLNTRIWTKH